VGKIAEGSDQARAQGEQTVTPLRAPEPTPAPGRRETAPEADRLITGAALAPEPSVDSGQVRQLVVQLGAAMSAAGDSVDSIRSKLLEIMIAFGYPEADAVVFPTAMFVETGHGVSARVDFGTHRQGILRFDQIARLYELIAGLQSGEVSPPAALAVLASVGEMKPRFGWVFRVLGYMLMTVGFALLLQPTVSTLIACSVLGLAIGLLKLLELPTLRLVFPTFVAFLVTALVLIAAKEWALPDPIRVLVPPLVTFLPGGVLTMATMELASGEMVAGASRLVAGFVELLLLAFGILAAVALVRAPFAILSDSPRGQPGWWIPWLGVIVFTFGVYLHLTAPARSLPWIFVVLVVAYAAQSLGATVFDGQLSGFFGALAMTPLVLWFGDLRHGPPKLITFLPGFWLLVPGAAGLISVTDFAGKGSSAGSAAFVAVLTVVVSIALGVLIGTAAYRTASDGTRRMTLELKGE
jgi:uncharacterized membrane protein YjjP (DUF1212 family)